MNFNKFGGKNFVNILGFMIEYIGHDKINGVPVSSRRCLDLIFTKLWYRCEFIFLSMWASSNIHLVLTCAVQEVVGAENGVQRLLEFFVQYVVAQVAPFFKASLINGEIKAGTPVGNLAHPVVQSGRWYHYQIQTGRVGL
ncbi:hypothetical protein BpHYR1_013542 [Brachionus plicatilis]|uniref:Uncharacterized protein n=1 Tax=Brachionus plicatilis TaxID=10195 RepID=A0A3M7SE27_BRAPC|nr:hypothetical protein BpHYR1_013542 [Brachionus plicatilis]